MDHIVDKAMFFQIVVWLDVSLWRIIMDVTSEVRKPTAATSRNTTMMSVHTTSTG